MGASAHDGRDVEERLGLELLDRWRAVVPARHNEHQGMLHGVDLRYIGPVIPSRLDRKTLTFGGGHHLRDEEVKRMLRTDRSGASRTSVLAGLLLLALSSSALAMHPATPVQRRQVAAKMGVPATCADVRISGVNHAWARFNSRNTIKRCQFGDGYVVLHRHLHRWHIVWEGSDLPHCPAKGVPYAVGADLRVCLR